MRNKKIRVLIVDDSALMRKMVSDFLNADERIEVVATAQNGYFALKKLEEFKPDIMTLDIDMPRMDGYTLLREVMRKMPLPVIILSGLTQDGAALTIKCLEAGAVDVIPKPLATFCRDITPVADELIKSIIRIQRSQIQLSLKPFKRTFKEKERVYKKERKAVTETVIAIGISTGGPAALSFIFPELPSRTPPIFVVQHMPANFTRSLAERLDSISRIRVKEAEHGDNVQESTAYIAPGDYHMEVRAAAGDNVTISLNQEERLHGVRPAVDVLFNSMSRIYGKRVMAVIMTGMGRDGVEGLKAIKERGGVTFAQDEASCVVYGMPKVAVNEGCVDEVVSLENIVEKLTE